MKKIVLCLVANFAIFNVFCQTINSGAYTLLPGDESLVGIRYRTLRGVAQTNAAGDESYLGSPDLGVASNRKQHDFTWGTSATWDFTFQYDKNANVLRTIVTDGMNTYQDTIQNISTYIAARGKTHLLSSMNFMNILVRTNSVSATATISNLMLNGNPIAGSYSANNTVGQWHIPSYNFGAGFIFTGTITTAGTFSTSQEGNKIEFSVGNGSALLPVVWGDVSCRREKEKVILTWETIEEKNNDYFEIETSQNGINFSKIGELKATSRNRSYYEFIHIASRKYTIQHRYYRIRQIDDNGLFSYSPVVALNQIDDGSYDSMLMENPIDSELGVVFQDSLPKDISIVDAKGGVLSAYTCMAKDFTSSVDYLSSGIYWVVVRQPGRDIQIAKFIKL